ncbi:unnamed protein product [Rotaria socialis]|uniref:Uncharacterized protein n=1 Tax=Rotaria socialis TaxID=392032 RepID=A0A820Z7V7_9BILA|nr:unnamed protein product [Rotaria socialis]CAF4560683.1 unnamed protein product [Rotaria socialis]
MKRKSLKRSIYNKNTKHSISSPSSTIDASTIGPHQVDLGIGTVHLDSHAPCLKANLILKSQKTLKRDLLRCSDQRPSLLGSQTLQPPRIHHGSQQTNTSGSSSTSLPVAHQQSVRHHSLSMNSRTLLATIDRIGPWPDISISRLRSDGNDLLRPLKTFRNSKNPRVFSPKYYAGLNENTSKFKFYPTTRTYIDEYRKQKGYVLDAQRGTRVSSLSLIASLTLPQCDDEQLSAVDAFGSAVSVDIYKSSMGDRAAVSTAELALPNNNPLTRSANDLFEYSSTPPSIPAVTRVFTDPNHVSNFPLIPMRNGHLRPVRQAPHHTIIAQQSQHQQSMTLPSLTGSSLHYASSMSSIEKAYSNSKKSPTQKQSKLFFIDERNRQRHRIAQRFVSDSDLPCRPQELIDIQATGAPVPTNISRSTAIVVYQLPRRPPQLLTSQKNVGPLS